MHETGPCFGRLIRSGGVTAPYAVFLVLMLLAPVAAFEPPADEQTRQRLELESLVRRTARPAETTTAPSDPLSRMLAEAGRHTFLIERIDRFLGRYPDDPARDELLIAKLQSIFASATLYGHDQARLQAEIRRLSKAPKSDALREAIAYWRLRLKLNRLERLAVSGRTNTADRLALMQAFVEKHPASPRCVPLLEQLLRDAAGRDDPEAADRWLGLLHKHHPRHVTTQALRGRYNLARSIGRPWQPELKTTQGRPLDWDALRGRVVLVVFWSSSHEPSVEILGRLRAIQGRHGSDAIEVVSVSFDTDPSASQAVLGKLDANWPAVCDALAWNGPAAGKWGIRSLPAVLVLDPGGNLRRVITEEENNTFAAVEEAVTDLLADSD